MGIRWRIRKTRSLEVTEQLAYEHGPRKERDLLKATQPQQRGELGVPFWVLAYLKQFRHCVSWSALCLLISTVPGAGLTICTFHLDFQLYASLFWSASLPVWAATQFPGDYTKSDDGVQAPFPTWSSSMFHLHLWVTNVTRLSMRFRLDGMVSIFLND